MSTEQERLAALNECAAGGGVMTMPDDGRERVWRRVRSVVTRYLWREMDVSPMTDAILAEIAAAGYVLVDRERWQRVAGRAEWSLDTWQYMGDEPIPTLQPGDLDPLPEVGE